MIRCKLVHDTGTIVRFRTSQLSELPSTSQDLELLLPNGRLVAAFFNRHRENPNISGTGLVRFIKNRVAFKGREDALVEIQATKVWVIHLVDEVVALAAEAGVAPANLRAGRLASDDLGALIGLADREAERGRRLVTYQRVLRPSGIRRLIVGLAGGRCMVRGCGACAEFDRTWGAGASNAIVEVHHLEEVARVVDHHPRNLCVLCGNHHRFVHRRGAWSVDHDGPNVVLRREAKELTIERAAGVFA